jgi:type II secretory pathway pseudopilin PulG
VRQRGFTFLWMLLIVMLMGAGLVVQAEIVSTAERREREQMLLAIGAEFRSAIGSYYQQTSGPAKQYPPSLEALLLDERSAAVRRHLRRIYPDPMTGKAEWGLVKVGERVVGVYSLSTVRPIKLGNFEPENAGFDNAPSYAGWTFTYVPPAAPAAPAIKPPSSRG